MTGALALLAGAGLLATGSLRLASRLASPATATFLLAAYVVAWAQLVLVLWALSLVGQVSRWPLLGALAVVCAALVVDTRGRSDVLPRLRTAAGALGRALGDPVCAVLAVAVAAALAYALVLGLATPQNDFDTLIDHLWRAALWHENRAAGYPDCACAPYINAYPPHGELGVLATMTLGGVDRYVSLVQAAAYAALPVGVVGIARGLGLSRREALVGGLLVATLPIIALQASTAQNDLVVASFLVAAASLLLDKGRAAPWLVAAATALAVGTKVTAVVGIPLLAAVAVLALPSSSRRGRLLTVLVGAALGSYWYAVNWWQTGRWDGGFPYEALDRGVADTIARVLRSGLQFVELPGGAGRDRWLFLVAAGLVALGLAIRGRLRVAALVAAGVAAAPVLTPDVRRYADQAYVELWQALGRDELAAEVGRDITRSASNVTWYGPLGAIMLVVGLASALIAVRRGGLPRVAALLALAPLYWLVALSVLLFYQDAAGRFFMAPMAVAAASWGLVVRVRWAAWGLTGIAVTALALAVLNDTKRPSGLALFERPAPPSYFSEPRWRAQGREVFVPELIRFVDERVPGDAKIGLAITPSDPGYVLLGPSLRRFELLPRGRVDAAAAWIFASGSARSPGRPELCSAWDRLAVEPDGWTVYRRITARC